MNQNQILRDRAMPHALEREVVEELQLMRELKEKYGLDETAMAICRKLKRDLPNGIFLYQTDLLFAASDVDVTLPLYKRHEWSLLDESSQPGLCGIKALELSLKAQYPNDFVGVNLHFDDLLGTVRNPLKTPELLTRLEYYDFEDLQLAAGLDAYFNDPNSSLYKNYKLVICEELEHLGHVAKRTAWSAHEDGHNLYIYLDRNTARESENHWKGMRKRIRPASEQLSGPQQSSGAQQLSEAQQFWEPHFGIQQFGNSQQFWSPNYPQYPSGSYMYY